MRIYLAALSPPCVGEDDRQLRWYIYRSKELLMGRVATSCEPWSPTTLDREIQIITRRTFALSEEDWPGESNKVWMAVRTACKAVLAEQLPFIWCHAIVYLLVCHELFGIDIALRDDWVGRIEINAGPGIEGNEARMVEELKSDRTGDDKRIVGLGGWEGGAVHPEKMRSEAEMKRSTAETESREYAAVTWEEMSAQFQYVLLPADEQQPAGIVRLSTCNQFRLW